MAAAVAYGQTAATGSAKPAGAKSGAAKTASQVDDVIQLVKSGMSESLIVRTLQKQNKPVNLSPADLVKLNNAGVSENIINVMMDPGSTPARPAAAAAPAVAPSNPPPPEPAPAASVPPAALPAPSPVSQKKRVIVDPFDYSTVMTSVQAVFGTNQDIGRGIQAMLVNRLTQQGKVVVVERGKIKQIESEQDMNASNRNKQGTGARIGRIRGADALLAGDITIFGRDDKRTNIRGGGILGSKVGALGHALDKDKAVVAVTYRLIDAETSEVIATGEARGESERRSNGWGGLAGAFGKGIGGAQFDMTSSNFAQTIIGEATTNCVNKLADIMNTQSEAMKSTAREVEAYVADVSGGTITINAGANDGVNAGDVFEIHKVLREVKDPVTKETLDKVTQKVGELTIVSVRDKIATGNYAGAPVQVGFIARKKI